MPSGIYIRTEESIYNMSQAHKGKKLSDETKLKMSLARKGENHPMYGKHHSKESIKKISESKKGQVSWNKGIPFSEETRQKMSESHQNRSKETRQRMSEAQLGHIAWNKGMKSLKETRKKISEALKGHIPWNKGIKLPQRSGENHPNWKGGITPLDKQIRCCFKYRQWRSDIFTRDDFTCQECGSRGCYLHAHHIKPFSSILQYYEITTLEESLECEELWNINNGITLCEECHTTIYQYIHIRRE